MLSLYNVYGDSALLVLNGTSVNNVNALLVLNGSSVNNINALLVLSRRCEKHASHCFVLLFFVLFWQLLHCRECHLMYDVKRQYSIFRSSNCLNLYPCAILCNFFLCLIVHINSYVILIRRSLLKFGEHCIAVEIFHKMY